MTSIFDLAKEADDVSGKSSGYAPRELPREGIALFRLREYVELGGRKDDWKGEERKNLPVRVTFELVHPDHAIKDDTGNLISYHTISVMLNKSNSDRSKYMKLFSKLNYDGSVRVVPGLVPGINKLLGKGFLGYIHHRTVGEGDKEKTYVNLDSNGEFTIGAPVIQIPDPVTGVPTSEKRPVPIPEMYGEPRLFLWENPHVSDKHYQMMWDSIYIDGSRDDGTSRNWMQERISSPDENYLWEGSRAQKLFKSSGNSKSTIPRDDTDVPDITNPVPLETKTAAKEVSKPKARKVKKESTPEQPEPKGVIDPLEALGI